MDNSEETKIIKQIKANDSSNFEILFKKYEPIVKNMRGRYTIHHFDWDDWLQEGRIVFFNSIINFDTDLGMTLGVFFRANFRNRIYSLLRFEMAYKRKAGLTAQSIEELDEDFENRCERVSKITPHQNLTIKENYVQYEALLSKFERKVSVLLFQGNEPKQIASILKCDVAKIQNALIRCKQKLSEQLYSRD